MGKFSILSILILLGCALSPIQAAAWDSAAHSMIQLDLEELTIHQAYLEVSPGDWRITGGLQQLQWGPGKAGDLFLSREASLWGIAATKTWHIGDYAIKTQQLVATIDPRLNKMFFAHRLESEIKPGLIIGLAESAVATGEFTPLLFNPIPIWPFYLTQHIIKKSEPLQDRLINVNLAIDAVLRQPSGTEVYGQLFIDDAQLDLERRGSVPDWGGFLVGTYSPELAWWPGWAGTLEYTLITNWTYTHKNVDNSYILSNGTPIGHWLGPDADALILRFEHDYCPKTSGWLRLQKERHGEGVLGEQWLPEYQKQNLFLSGVVEKRYTVATGIKQMLRGELYIESELSWTIKENADNILRKTSADLSLTIKATWQI